MPGRTMPHEELVEFLTAQPARTAKLATVREDGRPHVAPVWFNLDRAAATPESPLGDIVFTTPAASVKGRALRREARAALCVDDDRLPYSYVSIEGEAALSQDPDEVLHWAMAGARRYMPADRAEETARGIAGLGAMAVRIRPTHIVALAELAD
ncbi:PPOX class F420-dependent oxidoreductase [Streptomyces sp. ODS28]|uniref:PPOX class F420-dependent oxidoreductase n=1 Tax=Streptomyces sp. ODS28 TaxID=3136688 RepID=UPI0031EF681E